MGKKKSENKFGVQVGDMFCKCCGFEDDYWVFYQVTALKGTQTVVLRQIGKCCKAFDYYHTMVVPVRDAWVTKEEYVKRVHLWTNFDGYEEPCIYLNKYNSLSRYEEKNVYIETTAPVLTKCFGHKLKEYGQEFDIREGTGIFALEGQIESFYSEIPVAIRYPDGREEKYFLHELYLQGERNINRDNHTITYRSHCRSRSWIFDSEEIADCVVDEQEVGMTFTVSGTLSVENGTGAVCFGTGDGEDRIEETFEESGTYTKTLSLKRGGVYVRLVNRDRQNPFVGNVDLKIELPKALFEKWCTGIEKLCI